MFGSNPCDVRASKFIVGVGVYFYEYIPMWSLLMPCRSSLPYYLYRTLDAGCSRNCVDRIGYIDTCVFVVSDHVVSIPMAVCAILHIVRCDVTC